MSERKWDIQTAVSYLRQSRSREKDSHDGGSVSLAFQLDAVQRWCAQNDVTLLRHRSDVDESGGDPTRKGLDQCLADVKELRPTFVVFWDLKRLVRNLRLFLDVFDTLEDANAELVSCLEGSRHPAFFWKILALFGEEELERISTNITHGVRKAAERGRHHGYAPLGYLKTQDGCLVIDPETRWVVEWMYGLAMQGWTPTAICREANRRGVPTSGTIRRQRDPDATLGAPHWSRQTVTYVLRRPTYTGMVEAGRKSRNKAGRQLAIVRAEAGHEPIIDRAIWEAVQAALDDLSSPSSKRRGSWHWLRKRVACAACGSLLYYVDSKRTGSEKRERYFRCRRSYHRAFGRDHEMCPATRQRIKADDLERIVLDALRMSLGNATTAEVARRLAADERRAQAHTARRLLERERDEIVRQRANIVTTIQWTQSQEQLVFDLAALADADRDLRLRLEDVELALTALPEPPGDAEIQDAFDAIAALHGTIDDLSDEALAEGAALLGLRVTVDLDRASATIGLADLYRWCLS